MPDLRRLVDTLSTLIKMAFKVNFRHGQKKISKKKEKAKKTQCLKMQVIEKAEGNPDRVEVETSQLIFKVSDENQTELKHFITMFCFLTQVKQLKITPKYSLNK